MPPSSTPRFYTISLSEDDAPVTGYAFAFARYGTESQIHAELRQIVEGWGAPWQPPVLVADSLPLGANPASSQVFLAEAVSRHSWFSDGALDTFSDEQRAFFVLSGGYERWFCDPPRLPAHGEVIWRGRRALLIIDLDSRRLALAEFLAVQTLPTVLRPPSAFEAAIEAGRAQEWNHTEGSFRTPRDTRERWNSDRKQQQSNIGRNSLDGRRLPFMQAELQSRVNPDIGPFSAEHALNEEIGRAFAMQQVQDCVIRYMVEMRDAARRRLDDPVGAVREAVREARERLSSDLRRVVTAYLTDAIYPGRRRRVERSLEVPEADLTAPNPELASFVDEAPDANAEDAFLLRVIADELRDRIMSRLTDAQKRVFEACVLLGESEVEYARRLGRNAGTVRKQMFDIRRKVTELLIEDERT